MHNRTGSIFACIDGSRYSSAVCDYAAWVSMRTQAPLTLLHNIEHSQTAATKDYSGSIGLGSREALLEELTEIEAQRSRLMLEQGKLMLSAAKKRVAVAGIANPTLKQRHDGFTESLVALEDEIRVLVLGIRGEEHERDEHHLGAHLETSIRALHRPILVVNSSFHEPRTIMLAYDGSDASNKALELLMDSPLFVGLPIHLVTVGAALASADASLEVVAQSLSAAGHRVTAATLAGSAHDALFNYQAEHNIDLTLMGAFSHTRLREFVFGSVTVKMLLSSNRPLLLLR